MQPLGHDVNLPLCFVVSPAPPIREKEREYYAKQRLSDTSTCQPEERHSRRETDPSLMTWHLTISALNTTHSLP
jgi:hypothetical protein